MLNLKSWLLGWVDNGLHFYNAFFLIQLVEIAEIFNTFVLVLFSLNTSSKWKWSLSSLFLYPSIRACSSAKLKPSVLQVTCYRFLAIDTTTTNAIFIPHLLLSLHQFTMHSHSRHCSNETNWTNSWRERAFVYVCAYMPHVPIWQPQHMTHKRGSKLVPGWV